MELFGTAGIRGDARTEVTPALAIAVGRAAAADGDTFVVGRDGRPTGDAIAAAVEAGLESGGADVRRIGMVPTPALAYASRGRRGVMVTASHNPPQDNGLKLFVDGSEYGGEAERGVTSRLEADEDPVGWREWGGGADEAILPDYRDAVAAYARETVGDAADLRVAVDCGNGMASVATPYVLRELGATVVALNANVDGHFPGRDPKPTPESLTDLRRFVGDGRFDLGIGHDGDADRIVIVDGDGGIVHEDTVLAIFAGFYTRTSDAEDPVVLTTPNASGRVDEQVEAAGGRTERVALGTLHEGIAAERDADGGGTVVFAAEPWKHVHTRLGPWQDGVTSAAVLSALVARDGLAGLREPITERPYRKANVACPEPTKEPAMGALERRLPAAFPDAAVDTDHGVRLDLADGSWFLVRPSGTEAYVRVYAESEDVDALVETVVGHVEEAVADAGSDHD